MTTQKWNTPNSERQQIFCHHQKLPVGIEDSGPQSNNRDTLNMPVAMEDLVRSGRITETDVYDVPDGEMDDIPDKDFYKARIHKLRKIVWMQGYVAPASGVSPLVMKDCFEALYQDILEHSNLWFGTIFPKNFVHALSTASALGTLCTIHRQAGRVEECLQVMKVYMRVLRIYQQYVKKSKDPEDKSECAMVTYKANLIRINLGVQLEDREMAVTAFRDVLAYEQDGGALQNYLGVVRGFFPSYGPNYDDVSDANMYKVARFVAFTSGAVPQGTK